jgi:hypothetical protein
MLDDRQPDVVYHYTSADTLLKIVRSKVIWATNLLYLNDVKESDHCIAMLRKRLPHFLEESKPDDAKSLENAFGTITTGRWGVPYVSSFSQHRDSLPQWRSYCPAGNGVSIGFRTRALNRGSLFKQNLASKDPSAFAVLHRVRYLKEDDVGLADEILSVTCPRFLNH